MKSHWMWAALVGSALLVGCGDRAPENTQNVEQNAPVVPAGNAGVADIGTPVDQPVRAPAASPRRDDSAVPDRSARPATRATSGIRPASAEELPPLRSTNPARSTSEASGASQAPRWREVTVPAGTALPLELLTAISSETAQLETPVRARLRQGVVVDSYTALPAGTILHGTVIDVERAGRVQGRARLAFRFTEAELDGGREDLQTNPVTFEGEATKGEDATKIGAGAGVGAIIGGILGGGGGAAKGAVIGGAAGTGAVLATRGREVTLAAGSDLAATLATPLEVRIPAR